MNLSERKVGLMGCVLAGVLLAGCASNEKAGGMPQATTASSGHGAAAPDAFAAWPCLSYTAECGKIPTRMPVKKELAGPLNGDAARGKLIANERSKGNCIACHNLKGGTQPGSRGPDLSQYGTWGRTDAETYTLVYDLRTRNPDTVMPPFGTNNILTDQEIRDVVAYLQSSK
jgi:sulfur-oxidizing protein SoxX